MLSILIPVFNFDIRPLVADLHRQCEASGCEFEILCFDDGSAEDFRRLNREVSSYKNVIYKELPENLGRSAIRNALGKAARFSLLLFMDCDSKVVSEGYVGDYLSESLNLVLGASSRRDSTSVETSQSQPFRPVGTQHFSSQTLTNVASLRDRKVEGHEVSTDVESLRDEVRKFSFELSERLETANFIVYGGRCYSPVPPADPAFFFHWKYGIEREQKTVEQRRRSPYHSFMTNNFLIPRTLFLSILFDENLRQYGHEDTLFGLELARRQVPILHIENPLEHVGLESAEVFLEKTRQGVENLVALWRRGTVIETKLLRMFLQVKKWRLVWLLAQVFKWSKPLIVKNLKSKYPSLPLFDFFKLGYFSNLDSRPVST